MKKITVLVLLLAIVIPQVFARGEQEQETYTLVMVPKLVHPFYEPCYEGFKAAGEHYGVSTSFEAPPNAEVELQVKVIENLISRGVDAIAISATDDTGLMGVVDEAIKAGIKVITFDADAPSTKRLCYVGTNNRAAGGTAGEKMVKLMGPQGGKAALLLATLGAPNLLERAEEFQKVFDGAGPQYQIVAVEGFETDLAQAVSKTEALLQTHPDMKAFFGISAYGGPASATVLKEQGKAGKILVGGFDDLEETLDGIRDGSIQYTLVQKTFNMGWISVEMLLRAIEGKDIPENYDTGCIIVTKDIVDSYMEEMKKEVLSD
ncbi:MAG: sugar-binding protein [Deltaproteobacteria bacterium]|nr:sugar-binding protein [Deltaproteobacteria bacterium]